MYRNFGQSTNSPNEVCHKDLKSFLLTGRADLFKVLTCCQQMIAHKQRTYNYKQAEQETRFRLEYQQATWVGDLRLKVGLPAMTHLAREHRRLLASTRERDPRELGVCGEQFFTQYGLPCAHIMKQKFLNGIRLTAEDVHPRWLLRQSRVSN